MAVRMLPSGLKRGEFALWPEIPFHHWPILCSGGSIRTFTEAEFEVITLCTLALTLNPTPL